MPAPKRRRVGPRFYKKRRGGRTRYYVRRDVRRKQWKIAHRVPRRITPASYQRRTMPINFCYMKTWNVSPSTMQVINKPQMLCFVLNNPVDIFHDGLPFGDSKSTAQVDESTYAAPNVGWIHEIDNGVSKVIPQAVDHFGEWAKRFEKFAVIGTKVTLVFRPKPITGSMESIPSHTISVNTPNGIGTNTVAGYNINTTAYDASRIVTLVSDADPFGTNPESLNNTLSVPEIEKRAGTRSHRMTYTPAGKVGAIATIKYSPKKFWNLADLKDNDEMWTDLHYNPDTQQSSVGVIHKPVYGYCVVQKEEINSPTNAPFPKMQHDYVVTAKVSMNILFTDPVQLPENNIPTAQAPNPFYLGGGGRMGDQF